MDESVEKFVFPDGQQKRSNQLLDRMDRALVNAGRAIWRCIVDGFAAYGAAECGLLLDPVFEPTNGQDVEVLETPSYPCNYGAVRDEDLRSDFTDIDELIRALQTAGE
jgi:hypothetical protein